MTKWHGGQMGGLPPILSHSTVPNPLVPTTKSRLVRNDWKTWEDIRLIVHCAGATTTVLVETLNYHNNTLFESENDIGINFHPNSGMCFQKTMLFEIIYCFKSLVTMKISKISWLYTKTFETREVTCTRQRGSKYRLYCYGDPDGPRDPVAETLSTQSHSVCKVMATRELKSPLLSKLARLGRYRVLGSQNAIF